MSVSMHPKTKLGLQIVGWFWVFIFVMIGVLGAGLHIIDHFTAIGDSPALTKFLEDYIYGKEFYQHWLDFRNYPVARMTHMVLGILFVLIAPWQLVPKVRRAYPVLHRWIGRISLASSFILIVTGMMFAFMYTYTGFVEQVPTVTYSIIYTWLIFMAIKSILAGDVEKHREWMIRGFAMMMGISATRVWFYLFLKTTDLPSTIFFSSIFWLGLGVNLLIAEVWINMTRPSAKNLQRGATPRDQAESAQIMPLKVRVYPLETPTEPAENYAARGSTRKVTA